jgi:hypothetical protein
VIHELPNSSRVWVALLMLAGLVGFAGCSRAAVAPQRPANTDAGGNQVGVTGPRYGFWDGKLAVVVWFDTNDSSQGFAGEGPTAVYHGIFAPVDGRRFDWRCKTSDGKSGTLVIEGQPFDIAKGALFLVTTRDGTTGVQQKSRDLTPFGPDKAGVEKLAKEDADVAKFVAEAGKGK